MATPDILGSIQKIFRIGLSTSTGASTLRFSNSSGNLDLVGNPTANRAITIPDKSGTLALISDTDKRASIEVTVLPHPLLLLILNIIR
jgi:hypothetical protein